MSRFEGHYLIITAPPVTIIAFSRGPKRLNKFLHLVF